jgi:hypothetical protein
MRKAAHFVQSHDFHALAIACAGRFADPGPVG